MTPLFYELGFDTHGNATTPQQLDRLIEESRRGGVTDLIFLAHGFRCSAADATALYTGLLTNLNPMLAELRDRKFAVVGVLWPSQKFPESFGTPDPTITSSRDVQDKFVASVLATCDAGHDDPTEGLPLLHQLRGSELLDALQPLTPSCMEGGILAIPHPVLGAIDTFLNFMSWNAMKTLSGNVGALGLAASLRAIQQTPGSARIHLVGHSLGGRLMTACCKSLGQKGGRIASLSLLEAAFSHFGFSPDAGEGQLGFFRGVVESKIVSGPMISTFSRNDTVVGTAYAVVSRLAHDRLQAIGDAADPYGGIGHNGAQRTPESTIAILRETTEPYLFQPGIVTCLDGSAGIIKNHGDVTNPHVTRAIVSAISAS